MRELLNNNSLFVNLCYMSLNLFVQRIFLLITSCKAYGFCDCNSIGILEFNNGVQDSTNFFNERKFFIQSETVR